MKVTATTWPMLSVVQHIVEEVQEDSFVLFFAKDFLEGIVVFGTEVAVRHGRRGFFFFVVENKGLRQVICFVIISIMLD